MLKEADRQTLDGAFAWHTAISESVIQHRNLVLAEHRTGRGKVAPTFAGLTEKEIEILFVKQRNEVDGMCIVNILASAEATLRLDYRERVRRNRSDLLSRAYSSYAKSLTGQKSLLPDFDRGGILEVLKGSGAVEDHLVTDFRQVLKVRHWYAHGRHWVLKAKATHDPVAVYQTCRRLLQALPS